MKCKELTGKRFGRLTVIERHGYKGKRITWLCKCDCGNEKLIAGERLNNGQTQSCGCLQKECAKSNNTTHGMRHSKIYKKWESMKRRCSNPKVERYSSYGGRGIKFCQEWQQFEPFYKWAMESGYKEGLSIDRIDVDGNYEPSNCRWATMKEQGNNKTNNQVVIYENNKMTISELATLTHRTYSLLYQRIIKLGWDVCDAVK